MSDEPIKVGDELAFDYGYGKGRWMICKVDKVTPSGRIKCGYYTLNPDMTVTGRADSWSFPYRAQRVTDDIRLAVRRQELLARIEGVRDWSKYDVGTLQAVADVLAKATLEG